MTTSALSPLCMAAGDRRLRDGAALKFFWGPMDCGKSTLALQMHYNHSRQGRVGLVLTRNDRSHAARVTTRIGLAHEAIEVTDELNLVELVRQRWAAGERLDYVICDEACFYTVAQVEQMAATMPLFRHMVGDAWRFQELPTWHWPMLNRPIELAEILHNARLSA